MLNRRVVEPEEMDAPAIPTDQLYSALAGLKRLNRISNSAHILWNPIKQLASDNPARRLRILDIATGSGDLPIALWERAKRAGIDLEIRGIDINPRSVDLARRQAQAHGAQVTFET